MTYAVLHCSSDTNYFWHGDVKEMIAYHDLERTLPVFLAQQMKDLPFSHLLVINGPGGFSQLRIACLCVNLLKMHYPTLSVASRNKVDLIHQIYDPELLPIHHLMFIGMKKKLRSVHIPSKKFETVMVNDVDAGGVDYSLDMMSDHLVLQEHPEYKDSMIQYGYTTDGLLVTYKNISKTHNRDTFFVPEKMSEYITPEYMIEPSLG